MKNPFEILSEIQRVDTPEYLYDTILNKVNERKVIPLTWMGVAAALFLGLVSFDAYCILNEASDVLNQSSVEDLAKLPNNMLYHE